MINFPNSELVETNAVLYSQPEAIRKLATMMLANMAESNTDMVCDMPEEYETKAEVELAFQNLNEQALDMLDDVISELREKLEMFLRESKVSARVRRLDYDAEGKLSDITVDLSVE